MHMVSIMGRIPKQEYGVPHGYDVLEALRRGYAVVPPFARHSVYIYVVFKMPCVCCHLRIASALLY